MPRGQRPDGANEASREDLKAAFRERLSALAPPAPAAANDEPAATDPEEALRKLMVVSLPRLAHADADDAAIASASLLLSSLEAHALRDMRFVDAFNNLYEKTDTPRWRSHAARNALTEAYRRVLQAVLQSMEAGTPPPIAPPRGEKRERIPLDASPPRRILVLADHVYAAARIVAQLERVPGLEITVLVCNNHYSAPAFVARQCAAALRALQVHGAGAWRVISTARWRFMGDKLHSRRVLDWIARSGFDIGLHAMGVIYRRSLLDAFRMGVLNAHVGYLPTFRGRSVLEWSLLAGHPPAVTVFFIDEGIDTGERIAYVREIARPFPPTLEAFRRYMFAQDGGTYAAAVQEMQNEGFAFRRNMIDEGRRYYVMSDLLRSVVAKRLEERS